MSQQPGVYVTERPLPRVTPGAQALGTYGAFLGSARRGPTAPMFVDSWSTFYNIYGGHDAEHNLPVALSQYFSNGGNTGAWVCRIIASDSETAEATYADSTGDRLKITAITPGLWGDSVQYDITINHFPDKEDKNLPHPSDTFTLSIFEKIRGAVVELETFRYLSMLKNSTRYAPKIVNSSTIGSRFVRIQVLGGVADVEGPLTINTTEPVSLDGGDDGSKLVDSDYASAFSQFDDIEGMLIINCPGVPTITGLESAVADRGDSVLIVDTDQDTAPGSSSIGSAFRSSYSAVYYPWIYISDPDPGAIRGAVKKVPPGASVAGVIVRTDAVARGVFQAPAGSNAFINNAIATEFRLTNSQMESLAARNINVIRPVNGVGIAVMGARTRSSDSAQYLSVRRTLNYVKARAALATRFALFQPNTPDLWEQCRVANGVWLSDLWSIGGLAGTRPEYAYYVRCDETINTPTTIANGELHIEIGVAPSFPSEFIRISVGQFESDGTVVVQEG